MDYEFDTLVSRAHTGNFKYTGLPDHFKALGAISYSGAELDVKTAPCIRNALAGRALEGIYGFTQLDDEYLDAVVNWMRQVRQWDIEREWIVPAYGTMQAICASIRAFSEEGDGIIVQPPVYVLYSRDINRTRRKLVNNPLKYHQGRYHMNFEQLEQVMSEKRNKLMILCNPHNPIMDYWEREDLENVADLAKKHGVIVVCDEIFAEHVYGGCPIVPYAEIGKENCIITTSLGKAFNFIGSSHANVIIPDKKARDTFIAQRDYDHFGSIDPFIYTATLAAYTPEGKAWIDALLAYAAENIRMVTEFFRNLFPQVKVCRHRAGTLLWLDFNGLGLTEQELHDFLINDAAFLGDRGSIYGVEGTGFCRFQLGTPRDVLKNALKRLHAAALARKFVK